MYGDAFGEAILYAIIFIISIYSLYISIPFSLIAFLLLFRVNRKREEYTEKEYLNKRKNRLNLLIVALSAVSLALVTMAYIFYSNDSFSIADESQVSFGSFMSAVVLAAFISVMLDFYAISRKISLSSRNETKKESEVEHKKTGGSKKTEEDSDSISVSETKKGEDSSKFKNPSKINKGLRYGFLVGLILAVFNFIFSGFIYTIVFSPLLIFGADSFLSEYRTYLIREVFNCSGGECDQSIVFGNVVLLILFPLLGLCVSKIYEKFIAPNTKKNPELWEKKSRWIVGSLIGLVIGIVLAYLNLSYMGFLALAAFGPLIYLLMWLSNCGGEECWGILIFVGSYFFILITPLLGFLLPFSWDLLLFRKNKRKAQKGTNHNKKEKNSENIKEKKVDLETFNDSFVRDDSILRSGPYSYEEKKAKKNKNKFQRLKNKRILQRVVKASLIFSVIFLFVSLTSYFVIDRYWEENPPQEECGSYRVKMRILEDENRELKMLVISPYSHYVWEDEELGSGLSQRNYVWKKIDTGYLDGLSDSERFMEKTSGGCLDTDFSPEYLKETGGLCRIGYWLETENGTTIDSDEELLSLTVPIISEDTASSYVAVKVSDVEMVANSKIPNGYTARLSDGYLVQLTNKNTFGCGAHIPSGVIYKVTKDGQISKVAYERVDQQEGEIVCVD